MGSGRNVSVLRRGRVLAAKSATGGMQVSGNPSSSAALNSTLTKLFVEAYMRLCYSVKDMMPCQVRNLAFRLQPAVLFSVFAFTRSTKITTCLL